MKHMYMSFMLIKIKYIHMSFYVNHMHFKDIGHKTHKYVCFICFYLKLVFHAFSENLCVWLEMFFSCRITPAFTYVY